MSSSLNPIDLDINIYDFDWEAYIDNYMDLQMAGITTKEKAFKHWIMYGKKENRTWKQINQDIINNNLVTVYIISNIKRGGADKYLKDIINNYKTVVDFIYINSDFKLKNYVYKQNDIIFLQHILDTKIKIIDLINIIDKYKCKFVISIHDWHWLTPYDKINLPSNNVHNIYLQNDIIIDNNIKKLFNIADDILHPSQFTYHIFSKYIPNTNFKIISHNDYFTDYSSKYIPSIVNNIINIGVLHMLSDCKGKEYINILKSKYNIFNGYKINWCIVGVNIPEYNEIEFYEYVKKYNIHCLTFLNKWGETWCYSLTKGINSGLPIIYNNFGAFKERIPNNIEHYFKVYENESENDINILYKIFENMLNYIIENNGKFNNINTNIKIIYNDYYDKLFKTPIEINIDPFIIYFPQFHKIKENDKNYYENFSDITNLSLYFDENPNNLENLENPLLSLYNLSSLSEYNLENINITNKQVDIAKLYGIKGFAIYYYWFTINSITNENPIMERGYANFFKDTFTDFKVFFVWANEDWSNNPAFNTNNKIYNVYDEHSFSKNADNLLTYFKHDNYYKIDNKPIFMLHHPWLIDDTQIKLFNTILNKKCIENNFGGVILIINSMVKKYDNFNNYSFHPNYKKSPNGSSYILNRKAVIDYEKYIENINFEKNNINSLFFDFNNTARLYKPNKTDLSTRVIKNSDENIKNYIAKLKKCYSYNNPSNKINNILLINAWNEWGEKMHIEPSEEKQFYYLLIKQLINK